MIISTTRAKLFFLPIILFSSVLNSCGQSRTKVESKLTPMQKHEALGRLAFCFRKYKNDINLLGKVDKEGKSIYFTEAGLELYRPMEDLFKRTKMEWGDKLNKINLLNQPYNFSNRNFHKSNPIK